MTIIQRVNKANVEYSNLRGIDQFWYVNQKALIDIFLGKYTIFLLNTTEIRFFLDTGDNFFFHESQKPLTLN